MRTKHHYGTFVAALSLSALPSLCCRMSALARRSRHRSAQCAEMDACTSAGLPAGAQISVLSGNPGGDSPLSFARSCRLATK